jgi:nucleoside-diphosphate-sugar epimerase
MKIAVIGSSGEIGSRLAIELIQQKRNVHLYSRNLGLRLNRFDNVNFTSIDLLDKVKLKSELQGFDCIVNCAIDKREYKTEDESVEKNKEAILNLLQVASENGVKKFIELSSVAVLPPKITKEIKEKPYEYSKETDWYTRAKIENEKLALGYQDKMNVSVIRAGIVYGPYLHWSKLAFIRTQSKTVVIPNISESFCHAIHVDDLVGLILHTIDKENSLNFELIYGINPEKVSWQEYYDGHGKNVNIEQQTTQKVSLDEINLMNRIQGDELRRPGLKRTIIDSARSAVSMLPAPLKRNKISQRIFYKMKAMNYGLINYDSYLNPKKAIQLPKVYPNSFELDLYQTDYIPESNTDYEFKRNFKTGVKSAANWWLKSIEK